MKFIDAIVWQHAEEAAFLWMLRRAAIASPHYGLADLAKLDCRVDAHLDGLRVAGEAGWRFCEAQLQNGDADEAFAAGVMAFESGRPERIDSVLAAVHEALETRDGLASALAWLNVVEALPHIRGLLDDDRPVCQKIGVAAAANHRCHSEAAIGRLLGSEHAAVRSRALKALGELGDRQANQDLLIALRDPDEGCRFAAAWSGTLLGLPACLDVLRSLGDSTSPRAMEAASLALRRVELDSALSWHARLVSDPARIRFAILAAGTLGEPSLLPWLISLMDQFPLARLAGESFTMITGADLAYRDLEQKPPEDFNAGPTEDPADDNVEMDPDENLPWPDPALVQQWWDANRGRFQNGTRYLLGNPITDDWLRIVLRDGRQRQRAAAALEIALRNPGQPLFNVKAPGFRQQQLLGKSEVIR